MAACLEALDLSLAQEDVSADALYLHPSHSAQLARLDLSAHRFEIKVSPALLQKNRSRHRVKTR